MTDENGAPHVILTGGASSTPEVLPLLMLDKLILFPMAAMPIRLTDPNEKRLIDEAVLGPKMVAVLTLRESGGVSNALDAAFEFIHKVGWLLHAEQLIAKARELPAEEFRGILQPALTPHPFVPLQRQSKTRHGSPQN